MNPEAYTVLSRQMWWTRVKERIRGRWRRRVVTRWLCETRELAVEHGCRHPLHYYLHQTKHHYRRRRRA